MGSCIRLLGLVFWNSIHLEVASNPFCLLCNCPWLLVFALWLFFMILSGFNLYCWKGIHFSWSNCLLVLIFSFHFSLHQTYLSFTIIVLSFSLLLDLGSF